MKPAEIRALSDTELLNELETAMQRLFNLHFQRTTQNLDSPADLMNTRKDIARLRTILAERRRGHAVEAAPEAPAGKEEAADT
ncbi:MAG: 50S ribosomal protein L29 [Planctomycetota bacterium]